MKLLIALALAAAPSALALVSGGEDEAAWIGSCVWWTKIDMEEL